MSGARYQRHSETSELAARHVNRTITLRQRAVLNVIIAKHGATIAEIAKELGVPNNEVSGRIAELRDDRKMIVDSGIKRATVTSCRGIMWVLHPSVAPFMQLPKESSQNRTDVLHASTVAAAATTDLTNQPDLFGTP